MKSYGSIAFISLRNSKGLLVGGKISAARLNEPTNSMAVHVLEHGRNNVQNIKYQSKRSFPLACNINLLECSSLKRHTL